MIFILKYYLLKLSCSYVFFLWKESVCSDGQQFHNNIKKNREQSSLILTHWTHKALEIPVLGQAQLCIGLKQLMGSQPPS